MYQKFSKKFGSQGANQVRKFLMESARQQLSASIDEQDAQPEQNATNSSTLLNEEELEKQRRAAAEAKDVMISYSHQDSEFAVKLQDYLESHNISVWIDRIGLLGGDKFLDKIGEAIINCKAVIPIISSNQVTSKYCQSEVALAYISDKPMFALALENRKNLLQVMPTGMRLQLAHQTWINFHKADQITDESFESGFETLFDVIKSSFKDELELLKQASKDSTINTATDSNQYGEEPIDDSKKKQMRTKRPVKAGAGGHQGDKTSNLTNKDVEEDEEVPEDIEVFPDHDFWQHHFGSEQAISKAKFEEALRQDVKKYAPDLYADDDLDYFIPKLNLEMSDSKLSETIKHTFYEEFIHETEAKNFYERFSIYAVETLATKTVFDVDSKVRIDAIENLGKYKSAPVIEALLDLIDDREPDARAVALLSLARAGAVDDDDNNNGSGDRRLANQVEHRICEALQDPDRLVRECACLALGQMNVKNPQIVAKVVSIWRNDVIASVRASAELALKNFQTDEARMAIKMTEILKKEIEQLIN